MDTDRSTPPLASLYQEVILDHYKRPRNRGEMEDPDRDIQMRNPSCGDEIRLQMRLVDDTVEEIRFSGVGCSISQASVSMLTQLVRGKGRDEALSIARRFTAMMQGDPAAANDRELGDLRALAGVSKFPVRIKCALLGWEALEEALER